MDFDFICQVVERHVDCPLSLDVSLNVESLWYCVVMAEPKVETGKPVESLSQEVATALPESKEPSVAEPEQPVGTSSEYVTISRQSD